MRRVVTGIDDPGAEVGLGSDIDDIGYSVGSESPRLAIR
jgi:hypothetical protein